MCVCVCVSVVDFLERVPGTSEVISSLFATVHLGKALGEHMGSQYVTEQLTQDFCTLGC